MAGAWWAKFPINTPSGDVGGPAQTGSGDTVRPQTMSSLQLSLPPLRVVAHSQPVPSLLYSCITLMAPVS